MRTSVFILSLVFAMTNFAEANTTRILHVDSPETMDQPFEILTSGSREVIEVDSNNLELNYHHQYITHLSSQQAPNVAVHLVPNDDSFVVFQTSRQGRFAQGLSMTI